MSMKTKVKAMFFAALALAAFGTPAVRAADISFQITETTLLNGTELTRATWSSDPAAVILVTRAPTISEIWNIDLSQSGHATTGGDFTFPVNNGVMTWLEPQAGLYNNLFFVNSTLWRLESEQIAAANLDNNGAGIFPLGTSIFAGFDGNDRVFVSVNEVAETPEPATIGLLGIGLGGMFFLRKKRIALA